MALFKRNQSEDEFVDLRDEKFNEKRGLQFGYPTPCPACTGPGYLDSIDITRRVMYQHCPSCFRKYEVTEDELISAT